MQVNDERPDDGKFRVTQSHANLVNRMSILMLDRTDSDSNRGTIVRRKISSQGNLGLSLPFVPLKVRSGESSEDEEEDEDKEEHIVKIDSPSALFRGPRPDQS